MSQFLYQTVFHKWMLTDFQIISSFLLPTQETLPDTVFGFRFPGEKKRRPSGRERLMDSMHRVSWSWFKKSSLDDGNTLCPNVFARYLLPSVPNRVVFSLGPLGHGQGPCPHCCYELTEASTTDVSKTPYQCCNLSLVSIHTTTYTQTHGRTDRQTDG